MLTVNEVRQRLSIKARLLLLVMAMALALALCMSVGIFMDMQESVDATKANLRSFAKLLTHTTNSKITTARKTLEYLAERPLVKQLDPSNCDVILQDILAINHENHYANVTYTNMDGLAVCSALAQPDGKPVNVGKTAWFQNFLKTKEFRVGEPFMGPISKKWVSVLSVPIWNQHHAMIGGVQIPLDLGDFDPKLPTNFLPEGSRYGFFSEDGVLIWRNVDPNRAIGTRPDADATRKLLQIKNGEFEGVAGDGVRRFYAVLSMTEVGWIAFVGVPVTEIYAKARQRAYVGAGISLLVIAILVRLALVTTRRITRPIAELESAARAVFNGHLDTKVSTDAPSEIANVAAAFNVMTQRIHSSTRQLEAEIEERKQIEAALQASEQRFRDLFECSPDPACLIKNRRIMDCNLAAVKILGYASREELLAAIHLVLSPEFQPNGRTSLEKAEEMLQIAFQRGIHRFEWTLKHHDGHCFPVEVTLAKIILQGDDILYCIWRDITERKQLEEQVRHLAFFDPLTGLPNRRLLRDRLHQAMESSKRNGRYCALVILDLDNFKPLNDTHGHACGDLLLVAVAQRLRACVPTADTVSRFGGDEFVVLIGELYEGKAESAAQARLIAEKIRHTLGLRHLLTHQSEEGETGYTIEHQCTASIGVALFFGHEASQDKIMQWADSAMYQAKNAGRNQISFYSA
ncbi:MAG: diguanylate cyclase [Rhodoferax sp.]|nr:diguanylate cyclase [Rhodoferax sp.]